MNSHRIKRKFDSYGVDVLKADQQTRVSSLYSVEGGDHVTRTLAIVHFESPMPVSLKKSHQKVVSGASIGATFEAEGWQIEKELISIETLRFDPAFKELYAWMRLPRAHDLSVHTYGFKVRKNNGIWLHYAAISEIHSPLYLNISELNEVIAAERQPKSSTGQQSNIKHLLREFLFEHLTA